MLLFSQSLGGGPPKKLYPDYNAWLTACYMEKFCEVSPPRRKVIGAQTLNFKPIFECLLLKIVVYPHPTWCVLASLSQCLPRLQI